MNYKNLFKAHSNMCIVQKIVFTGIFLGCVLFFQFLEQYMPLGFGYIKINLSLLFILPIFYFAGALYGMSVIILRFILTPFLSPGSVGNIAFTGSFILMVCSIVAISIMYVFSVIFFNLKNRTIKTIMISLCTWIGTSIFLTIINQIFFTPLYFQVLTNSKYISISKTIDQYQKLKNIYFGINNYWLGTFTTYFSGNLIKYGIIFTIYLPLSKTIYALIKNKNVKGYN